VVVHFFDADGLSGKDLTEIDFLLAQTDTPAAGDYDGFIVEGIVDELRVLLPLRYSLYEVTNAGRIWLGSAETMTDVAKQLLKIVKASRARIALRMR